MPQRIKIIDDLKHMDSISLLVNRPCKMESRKKCYATEKERVFCVLPSPKRLPGSREFQWHSPVPSKRGCPAPRSSQKAALAQPQAAVGHAREGAPIPALARSLDHKPQTPLLMV